MTFLLCLHRRRRRVVVAAAVIATSSRLQKADYPSFRWSRSRLPQWLSATTIRSWRLSRLWSFLPRSILLPTCRTSATRCRSCLPDRLLTARVLAVALVPVMGAVLDLVKVLALAPVVAVVLVVVCSASVAVFPLRAQFSHLILSIRKKRAKPSIREPAYSGWSSDQTVIRAISV